VYVNVPTVFVVWVTAPDGSSVPDHGAPLAPPPLAVHAAAFVDDHVRVTGWPLVTFAGFATSVAVGTAGVTVSVRSAVAGGWPGSMLSQDIPNV
jgi:hypothetical protein